MTSCWRRLTQPETTISKNASNGGAEPMPKVYREPSFEILDTTGAEPMAKVYRELSFEFLDITAIAVRPRFG